ncbi:hypothetical protein QWY20_15235 [Alkalimonas sp. MEB108]|uniref:Uncharacterized protein n=1 Tax=Alkalimonas cellulosilytica TaxID=3058395 RepID=A0ABU7J8F6_9GAMM|nr:hypothetical protein [Alkalimonas sp. MEB108]MEE2002813.1 hypothetical protein [Alkalimonas sp. MEB108]
MSKKTRTYTLGSKDRYEGLIVTTIETYRSPSEMPASPEAWDLELMIPHLAEQHFGSYLHSLDLPSKFDPEAWSRKRSKEQRTLKPAIAPVIRFERFIKWRAKKAKLHPQKLEGVRIALNGLRELFSAEGHAISGNYEKAAVHIGRAMPIAVILKMMEMEHPYQTGLVRHKTNAHEGVACIKRDKDLSEIIARLAKSPGTAKELWPAFFGALDEEGLSPVECSQELKYTYRGHKGKDKKIAFTTFQNRLSTARKFGGKS